MQLVGIKTLNLKKITLLQIGTVPNGLIFLIYCEFYYLFYYPHVYENDRNCHHAAEINR